MNLHRFITRKVANEKGSGKLAKPVVNIATIGIAIGVALMIISIVIVKGFQEQVRGKVIGFGAHIQVTNNDHHYSKETARIEIDQPFYPEITETDNIKHIQVFATKPGIIETNDDLQGCIIKGVGEDFDWSFFDDKIVAGKRPNSETGFDKTDLLVSQYIVNRLELAVGDKVTLYFVQSQGDIRPRVFNVCGVYETGLKEFDEQFVFIQMSHIQKINLWGIEAQLKKKELEDNVVSLEALAFGGQGNIKYRWSDLDWEGAGPHEVQIVSDTSFQVVIDDTNETLPDTATYYFFVDEKNQILRDTLVTSGASHKYYAGGFEILIDNFEDLAEANDEVMTTIGYEYQILNIVDRNQEIFSWLEMLDLNVIVIIVMMILISVVNMTSALLIIILERTNMIGILKAFGMQDGSIVNIFVRYASRIIGVGMLIGVTVGMGLSYFQYKTKFVKLDAESYYVSYVPIKFDWLTLSIVGSVTLIICIIMMILPSFYSSRITPVKAIRFD